jgi:hypothetical protein
MARSIIAKWLQHNDKEVFDNQLRKVLGGLIARLTNVQNSVRSIEIVFLVTLDYFEPYFPSSEVKEQIQDNIHHLQDAMKEVFQFANSFYGEFRLEMYVPYSEAQWNEFYIELSHGIKRRVVVIKQILNAFCVPEITLPIQSENTQLKERITQSFQAFPHDMTNWLAQVQYFLDEDYLETLLSDDL